MTALAIHPLANLIPAMLMDEVAGLERDIQTNKLRQPITLFEGKILDGRHRYAVCMKLGITPTFTTFEGTEAEAKALVLSLNVHRRHLTFEDKQRIIGAELKRDPTQSDRAIGEKAKVDHKTVAAARASAEGTGEIPQLKKRVGADGKARKQPAKKPTTKAPAAAKPDVPPPSPGTPPDLETILADLEARGTATHLAHQLRQRLALERDRVDAEITKRVEAAVAQERARQQRVDLVWSAFRTVDEWMTKDEFRLVLQCLHPDHAPEDRRDKYTRAFTIFNRLQDRTSKNKRDLARNGWATKPPEKPRKPAKNGAGDAQATAGGAA